MKIKSIFLYIIFVTLFPVSLLSKEVILIRHAKVDLEIKGWMTAKKAANLRQNYDTAPITNFAPDTVLSKLPQILADTVHTSLLYRSMATAGILFDGSVTYIASPVFNEFNLPVFGLPLVLPYKGWAIISRAAWLLGWSKKDIESHKDAKQRVQNAVHYIEELAKTNNQVVLVTHGYINRNIKNELKKRGWKVKQNEGKKNLGATILIK